MFGSSKFVRVAAGWGLAVLALLFLKLAVKIGFVLLILFCLIYFLLRWK